MQVFLLNKSLKSKYRMVLVFTHANRDNMVSNTIRHKIPILPRALSEQGQVLALDRGCAAIRQTHVSRHPVRLSNVPNAVSEPSL